MYEQIVEYEYDAWGKVLSVKDANGQEITVKNHIAHINPFRYRSYYYDEETKLYYLNSRYYNPEWGRFINVDDVTGELGNILSHNLYQYAFNNPITYSDDEGQWPNIFKAVAKVAVGVAAIAVGAVIATATIPSLTFEAAMVAGLKIAATVGVVASGVRSAKKIAQSVAKKEDAKAVVESAVTGAVNGFSDGFLGGSISSEISFAATLYPGFEGIKIGKTDKPQYGKLTIGYNANDGITLFAVSNIEGGSKFRMEMDYENLFHTHFKTKKHGNSFHRTKQTSIIFGLLIGLIGD